MCLIAFAWQAHPTYDLIVAANRDERYQRPSQPAHWWDQDLLAGRDCLAGGSWCALTASGRFAAVTNVHQNTLATAPKSRGQLVLQAARSKRSPAEYARQLESQKNSYGPFNLLTADHRQLYFMSNRGERQSQAIAPGVYAISNDHWPSNWPKTQQAERQLRNQINNHLLTPDHLLSLLTENRQKGSGLSVLDRPSREQLEADLFVRSKCYGTRASTLILRQRSGEVYFYEQSYAADGRITDQRQYNWSGL